MPPRAAQAIAEEMLLTGDHRGAGVAKRKHQVMSVFEEEKPKKKKKNGIKSVS